MMPQISLALEKDKVSLTGKFGRKDGTKVSELLGNFE